MPGGFPLAIKGSRFITHMKRLREVEVPLANFFASGRWRWASAGADALAVPGADGLRPRALP